MVELIDQDFDGQGSYFYNIASSSGDQDNTSTLTGLMNLNNSIDGSNLHNRTLITIPGRTNFPIVSKPENDLKKPSVNESLVKLLLVIVDNVEYLVYCGRIGAG